MTTLPESPLMDIRYFENDFHALIFEVRKLLEQRRQFAVSFDSVGRAELSAPKVGDRNPAVPQPEPPMRQAAHG